MPKSPSKRKSKRKPAAPSGSAETRAAETATVAWLLSAMMSSLCQIGAVVAGLVAYNDPNGQGKYLFMVLTFGALVVSLVCLFLTWVVWKSRVEKPPRPLLYLTLAVSCFPFLMALIGQFS